jgi:putative transposase
MALVEQNLPRFGLRTACKMAGVSRANYYRWKKAFIGPKPLKAVTRSLGASERLKVLDVLHEERFVDKAPGHVYAALLDENRYLCSERTMYRILAARGEVKERRAQRRHVKYEKPELLASAPNQVWSWDITKLRGPQKWSKYYLYVIIDIFSRYITGWMLAHKECASLAKKLIESSCRREGIEEEQLVLHSDRGSSMTSQSVGALLLDLGVAKSFSRPYIPDDNPFSEAQFKTLKYQPSFPDRFQNYGQALRHCRLFFPWYNHEHYHSGLGMYTPADVHYGRVDDIRRARNATLQVAYLNHPERFVKGLPQAQPVPEAVYINPPNEETREVAVPPQGISGEVLAEGAIVAH